MIPKTETINGFFESITEAKTVNQPKNSRTVERTNREENKEKNFEKTFNSVYREDNTASPKKTTAEKNEKKIIPAENKKTEVKQTPKTDDNAKAAETEYANTPLEPEYFENAPDFDLNFDVADNAIQNIEDALNYLRETLNIDIDTQNLINLLDDENIPEEAILLFKQVLGFIKELEDMLQQAGLDGETIEIKDKIIPVREAIEIGGHLKEETVKLELSLARLGISYEDAQEVVYDGKNINEANVLPKIPVETVSETPTGKILPQSIENIPAEENTETANVQKIIEKLEKTMNKAETIIAEKIEKTDVKPETAAKTPVIEALGELKELSELSAKDVKVQETPKTGIKAELPEVKTENVDEIKTENKEIKPANIAEIKTENISEVKAENVDEVKTENKEIKAELPKIKPESKEVKTENITEVKAEVKEAKTENVIEAKKTAAPEIKTANTEESNKFPAKEALIKESVKTEESGEKIAEKVEIKKDPAVAAQTVKNETKTENEADAENETDDDTPILKVLSASENNKKENGKGENQHKQERQNLPVEKEVSTPIRDAMMRADAAKVNSPIVLDGISIEANKFNDSSEITAVSPRFVKIFEKEIVEQVQRTILNSSNKNGIHEISLTLNPEKLGEIKLTIQVDGNIVSARMSVENLQVKQIIEQNMQNLKDSLAQHSLDTGSLDVNVGESDDYRELFERMSQARNRVNRKNKLEAAANETAAQDLTGVDTGRRFGTNSFELYA